MELKVRPKEQRQYLPGGPLILWRSKPGSKKREGLLCNLASCEKRECLIPHMNGVALFVPDSLLSVNRDKSSGKLSLRIRSEGWTRGPSFPLTIDLATGEVCTSTSRENEGVSAEPESLHALSTAPDCLDAVEWLRSELDGKLLESLYDAWLETKGWQRGGDGWKEDDWSWWEPGDLIPADHFIPGDRPDEYVLEGRTYLAVDYHCVTPSCNCRKIKLHIVRIEAQKQVGIAGDLAVILPDQRVTKWEPAECTREQLEQIWAMHQQRHRGLARLEKRNAHTRACGVALFALRGYPLDPGAGNPVREGRNEVSAGSQARVGRNAQCPCGSGKKFKHCCGKGA